MLPKRNQSAREPLFARTPPVGSRHPCRSSARGSLEGRDTIMGPRKERLHRQQVNQPSRQWHTPLSLFSLRLSPWMSTLTAVAAALGAEPLLLCCCTPVRWADDLPISVLSVSPAVVTVMDVRGGARRQLLTVEPRVSFAPASLNVLHHTQADFAPLASAQKRDKKDKQVSEREGEGEERGRGRNISQQRPSRPIACSLPCCSSRFLRLDWTTLQPSARQGEQ